MNRVLGFSKGFSNNKAPTRNEAENYDEKHIGKRGGTQDRGRLVDR